LHPDEGVVVNPALSMVVNRTFEPNIFWHPNHLGVQITMLIHRALVWVHGIHVTDVHLLGTEILYTSARAVSGLFNVGTIVLAYKTGSKFEQRKKHVSMIGLVCVFLFSFFPIFITHARYATPDTLTVFFILLFIYAAFWYMENPSVRNLLIMSFITAGFISVRYTGLILCIMIALLVVTSGASDKMLLRIAQHGFLSVLGVLFFTFLLSPSLILRFYDVYMHVVMQSDNTAHLGAHGLGWVGNVRFYVTTYLNASGMFLLIPFVIGCYVICKTIPKGWLLYTLPLLSSFIYWLALASVDTRWERWGLPMFVSPLIISAVGIVNGYTLIKHSRYFGKRRTLALKGLVVLYTVIVMNFISGASARLLPFLLPDTRVISQEYTAEHSIDRSNSAFEGYTPLHPTGPGTVFNVFEWVGDDLLLRPYNYQIQNIILSGAMFNRFFTEPLMYPKEIDMYLAIKSQYVEVKRFSEVTQLYSMIDIVNIGHNLSYIVRALRQGYDGPTLIFYRVDANGELEIRLMEDYISLRRMFNDKAEPNGSLFSASPVRI